MSICNQPVNPYSTETMIILQLNNEGADFTLTFNQININPANAEHNYF
jgi:hypothetical protein